MKTIILYLACTLSVFGFSGTIVDANSSKPLADVLIIDGKNTTTSDKNGTFAIKPKTHQIHFKKIGYRPLTIKADTNATHFKLDPIRIKALYLTFWGASNNSKTFKRALDLIEKTNLNAVVVDVKNEYGSTLFWTHFKQANSYGAHLKRTNRNIEKFIQTLKAHNIYTIARIVSFKDELQASHNYDYAIKKNDANQTIWRNHDNMAWVDPFDVRSHNYTIAIAEEAARVGFDEINFDYVRFPAKKGLVLAHKSTQHTRTKAIEKFLDTARKQLQPYGVFVSVDIYGNVCWSKDDNGIGQTIGSLSKHVDYLCPMLYPSGFSTGSFEKKYPAKHPYIVVYRSIKHMKPKIESARVRPWLQYFKDYTRSHVKYGKKQIQAQIKATNDMQTNGWMVWSPSSKYKLEDFFPDETTEDNVSVAP